MAADPDPETRDELAALVAGGEVAELADRFSGTLEFGTAGLRGALGAGPMRMNRLLVQRAAAGFVDYLGQGATVVVGFDARHKSARFAEDTARVVAGAGGRALVLPGPLPTPVLAFAVLHLGADGGVMVTASHNPPADNGYKVYLGDGAQIVPPHDRVISEHIAAASRRDIPIASAASSSIERLGDEVVDAYLDVVAGCRLTEDCDPLSVVYTAMHGVGRDVLLAAFDRCGFAAPHVVAPQAEPDPDFPTVVFPNPEEPGALDLALAEAERVGADLVIANDPDADRLGVAVPTPDGGWRALTGNEIGVLLADHILRHTEGDDRLVVTTIVSSRLLERMADAAGVRFVATLTGFKWIVRPGLEDPRARFVFGYEEALGYSVTSSVRDKDGITAAVTFVELAGALSRRGATVLDRLDELALEHGLHATETWSIRVEDLAEIGRIMAAARGSTPPALAGHAVTGVHDYAEGGALMPTDAVEWQLDDGSRVVLRPSGTEPKAKVYLEVVDDVADGDVVAARQRAAAQLGALRTDLGAHLDVDAGRTI
ncbi:phospho-sugar mutase [Actinomarinicola tropica]|uniref:Phospho-sugar mutase n=2 Tax=Actinomarinicola tropica TaxID=2789776 RepID=A0A5Q2RT76_9ACTN|nr:phospho-sugar mutase [Actinomarinicola tropica]